MGPNLAGIRVAWEGLVVVVGGEGAGAANSNSNSSSNWEAKGKFSCADMALVEHG